MNLRACPRWTGAAALRACGGMAWMAGAAGAVFAHGFDERYDLPVPLRHIVIAACAAVALTFAAAVAWARAPAAAGTGPRRWPRPLRCPAPVLRTLRVLAWVLFLLAIAAALFGTRDPLMNLAPTLVWIVWWIGMAFVAALVSDLWPVLDPWRTTHDLLQALRRQRRPRATATPPRRWPAALGLWPATPLLLAWCWLEIVHPLAATPQRLGMAALLWTVVNVGGMVIWGRAAWQAHADVFAVVFSTLGRMAPLQLVAADARPRAHAGAGAPGQATAQEPSHADALASPPATAPTPAPAGQAAFVMALLSTVIFDGLHGGSAWNGFEALLRRVVPQWMDVNGWFAGTAGLVLVWMGFVLAYELALRFTTVLLRGAATMRALRGPLALTLVPIALGYNVAHNFSSLLIQGQSFFALLSDPFGRQWNLFGTARWVPDIGLVDARLTWIVAVTAIVAGHMLSIWWSHRIALAAAPSPRRAALAMLPMTALMLAYTAVSLVLIAEPMVVSPP